jgi:hypothetical protein
MTAHRTITTPARAASIALALLASASVIAQPIAPAPTPPPRIPPPMIPTPAQIRGQPGLGAPGTGTQGVVAPVLGERTFDRPSRIRTRSYWAMQQLDRTVRVPQDPNGDQSVGIGAGIGGGMPIGPRFMREQPQPFVRPDGVLQPSRFGPLTNDSVGAFGIAPTDGRPIPGITGVWSGPVLYSGTGALDWSLGGGCLCVIPPPPVWSGLIPEQPEFAGEPNWALGQSGALLSELMVEAIGAGDLLGARAAAEAELEALTPLVPMAADVDRSMTIGEEARVWRLLAMTWALENRPDRAAPLMLRAYQLEPSLVAEPLDEGALDWSRSRVREAGGRAVVAARNSNSADRVLLAMVLLQAQGKMDAARRLLPRAEQLGLDPVIVAGWNTLKSN